MTRVTTLAHPGWCSPVVCSAHDSSLPLSGGEHRSEPVLLDLRLVFTARGAVKATAAYLTKAACAWDTETFLHLATDNDDLSVPLSQAAGLLQQLTALVTRDNH